MKKIRPTRSPLPLLHSTGDRGPARKWPCRRSPTTSWRRYSSACPPRPTSSAPPPPAWLRLLSQARHRPLLPPALPFPPLPPFLGFLDRDVFHPALPPHPSEPAARAVSLATDFSFSFLPSHDRWIVRDVRDGRFLLDRAPEEGTGEESLVFTELAVCDPLQRRWLLLPPIPDDLASSVEHPLHVEFGRCCEPFLVPSSEEEEEEEAAEETSCRVIWMAQCKTKLVAFVFSSSTGQWRAVASHGWSDLLGGTGLSMAVIFSRQYACSCFYWVVGSTEKLLVLDTRRMEFSIADLPPGCRGRHIAIVDAGEGRPGMFAIREHIADDTVDLYYTIRRNEGESSEQWLMEKTIPFDSGYWHCITGAMEMYLLLLRYHRHLNVSSLLEMRDFEWFSLDVKTAA